MHCERWEVFFAMGARLEDAVESQAWAEWVSQQAERRKIGEQLKRLDRRLGRTSSAAPMGTATAARRGLRPRARGTDDELVWLRGVLEEAVGERHTAEVSRPAWGRRSQVQLDMDRGLGLIFLSPADADSSGAVSLQLYPGDTLAQARRFYPRMDRAGRARLVELASTPGWSVRPNFHLGTRTRGWLHDEAPGTLTRYVDYWHAHID